jgi:hypothetical protein
MPSTTSLPEWDVAAGALRVVERDAVLAVDPALTAPPFERVRPARAPQVGQAPGPCEASTFWAMVICWDFVARLAVEA